MVLCVLAGTWEFCFCPQYCEKNIQILKDRHFSALELPQRDTDAGLNNSFCNFPDFTADVFYPLPHSFFADNFIHLF